ncbi:hypothetical protein Tco_0835163 [Tanacetum coccineum]
MCGVILDPRKRNVNNDGIKDTNTSSTRVDKGKATQVDKIIRGKTESSNWSKDMIKYFKHHWEIDMLKEQEDQSKNVEDVFENVDGIGQTMTVDNVTGFWVSNVSHSQNRCRILNEEHSNGGSRVTNNMQDFIDCVNEAEVEDLSDRAMVNDDLMLQFYDANALFLPYLVSDHSPVVVRFPYSFRKKKKAFIFANFIAEKDEFIPIVATGWEIDIQGHRMYKLVKKMKALKYNLNALSWKNGNLSKNVEKCKNDLKIAQTNLDKLEEKLMDGQFVNHFRNFLGANKVTDEVPNFEGVFGTKLNHEDAMEMIKEVTDFEIKNALFDIGDNKAPGPDGYTSTFFKKSWKIVGKDVCIAIKEFFTTGKLLREMNATIISLIPKIITPNKVFDYRPIACCNVIYKCIRRFIQDNILITQELLKGYDRKSGPSRCCMKIDIAKAYDIVD